MTSGRLAVYLLSSRSCWGLRVPAASKNFVPFYGLPMAMLPKTLVVVGAVVLALLAVGSGAMIALSGDGEKVPDTPSPTTEPASTSAPTGACGADSRPRRADRVPGDSRSAALRCDGGRVGRGADVLGSPIDCEPPAARDQRRAWLS